MSSITIRNLDDGLKQRLRVRAAQGGRSMEEEVRIILREAVGQEPPQMNLAELIRSRFAGLYGDELAQPEREPMREPPVFDG
jgi:plasmid stability protein